MPGTGCETLSTVDVAVSLRHDGVSGCVTGRPVNEIRFVDTTVRDGQQSLWALNMKTGAMLAIAEQMDQCGFEGMEFFVTVMIKKYVREHKENPWDWLRLGSPKFARTRLRYHGGLHAAFEKVPSCVLRIMIERAVAYGLTLTRTSTVGTTTMISGVKSRQCARSGWKPWPT
jgi:pyruvate carboxylase